MATNQDWDNVPLTFDLPDGDTVELCSWKFVLSKLNELIEPLTSVINNGNHSLDIINEKLIEWGPDENEEEVL